MGPVWAWARLDVRRRWGALLALMFLVAVSTFAVLAAATAAHRGATALDRLDRFSAPATVQVPNYDARIDLSDLSSLPYVEAVSRVAGGGIGVLDDGHQGSTDSYAPVDRVIFDRMERPVVLAGRMFDPHSPDEAVITEQWAKTEHRGIGDTAAIQLPTRREQATGNGNSSPTGPDVTLHIVGIIRVPAYIDWPGQPGWFIPSPGFAEHYRNIWDTAITAPACVCQWASAGALVRLEHGLDDIARLRADLARMFPHQTFNIVNLEQQRQTHQHDILVQAWGLLAFAAAALVAALVIVGQAVARHVASAGPQLHTSRALGFSPGTLVAAVTLGPAVASGIGALLGVTAAIVTSHWTPIGLAKAVEPTPGTRVDLGLLTTGAAIAIVTVVVVAALTGRRTLAGRSTPVAGRSVISTWVSRTALPVPVQVGTRFALERGHASRALPVTQTVLAFVIAVTGTSAALVVNAGVNDALNNPIRYGQTYQSASFVGFGSTDFLDPTAISDAIEPIPYVSGFALPRESSAAVGDGRAGIPLFSVSRTPKPLPIVVLAGRLPTASDEVALAPASLRAAGAAVGDTLSLRGSRGSEQARVVGKVLMPLTDLTRYDEGGWVTDAGYDRLFSGFDAHWVFVGTEPSAGSGPPLYHRLTHDAAQTLGAHWAQIAAFNEMGTAGLTTGPLRQIRWFPAALGLLVALLAIAALVHAGAVAVRRRASELAGLRALGMTPNGTRVAVLAQAGILSAVGLLFGFPLGAALGRTVWRLIASGLPLQLESPSLADLWVIAPSVIAVAGLLAVVPALRAGRLRVIDVLRSE